MVRIRHGWLMRSWRWNAFGWASSQAGFDYSSKKRWCHVPLMSIVCNHGDRLLVVPRQYATDESTVRRVETHALADGELKHFLMGAGLLQEAKPFNNAAIQILQLRFVQMIQVKCHNPLSNKRRRRDAKALRQRAGLASIDVPLAAQHLADI
jgi:hypothetical protein